MSALAGGVDCGQCFELASPRPALGIEKAGIEEAAGIESRGNESGEGRVGARYRDDRDAGLDRGAGQAHARIGDSRHARVADHGHATAFGEQAEQLPGTRLLVVFVAADGCDADVEVVQELLREARIFARDQVDALEDAEST